MSVEKVAGRRKHWELWETLRRIRRHAHELKCGCAIISASLAPLPNTRDGKRIPRYRASITRSLAAKILYLILGKIPLLQTLLPKLEILSDIYVEEESLSCYFHHGPTLTPVLQEKIYQECQRAIRTTESKFVSFPSLPAQKTPEVFLKNQPAH